MSCCLLLGFLVHCLSLVLENFLLRSPCCPVVAAGSSTTVVLKVGYFHLPALNLASEFIVCAQYNKGGGGQKIRRG